MKKKLLLPLVLFTKIFWAQFPESDIYLFELDKKNPLIVKKVKNITLRKGYDNQPSFSLDDKGIYFVSIKEDAQADVFLYNVSSGKTTQITKTGESEYSPVELSPGKLSAVCVKKDSAQVIRIYSVIKNKITFSDIALLDSVGYYTFLNSDTVIYYKLTEPHSLRYYCEKNQAVGFLGDTPTRTFKALSRNKLLYGIKQKEETRFFIYDFTLQKAILFATTSGIHEDIFVDGQNRLYVSEGSKILRFNPVAKQWDTIYDLQKYGIAKITRFACSKNGKYLVVVNNL